MAIELSLYLVPPPGAPGSVADTPSNSDRRVDGGGSRLRDALELAEALGGASPAAHGLLARNENAAPEDRRFVGPEIEVLTELVEGVRGRLPACFNAREEAMAPAADPLLASGVCQVRGGRLVLGRSGHGPFRVLEDLEAVAHLLARARSEGWEVLCDFDEPDA